jgi:hypothetical protein
VFRRWRLVDRDARTQFTVSDDVACLGPKGAGSSHGIAVWDLLLNLEIKVAVAVCFSIRD